MKPIKHESLWVGIIYFLILLGIALWVRDITNQLDSFSTIQQLIKTSQLGDPIYSATAAMDIAEKGWISSANDWILNLWPPGFILLEALIIKLLGADAPVILVLQILAAVLFSIVLGLLFNLLRECAIIQVAFILPLLIFAFPVSRVFLLQPTGISLGESFAIGFFLIGILLAFRSVERNLLRYAAYAGLCLALSAYFRSQFEIILLALTGWGFLLLIAIQLTRLRKSIEPRLVKSVVRTVAVTLLIAHTATMPWRAYQWINHGKPVWVATSNLVFANSVQSTEHLNSGGAGFVVAGGGNLVCRIDPTTCGDTAHAKELFVKTFTEHPVEWYALKFDVIGKYWFSSVQNWVSIGVASTFLDIIANGIFLVALIILVVLLFTRKVRSHDSWILLIWFNIALLSAYLLIFTLIHFETRYFYFPKIAGIVMVLIVACLYWRPMNKIDITSKETSR